MSETESRYSCNFCPWMLNHYKKKKDNGTILRHMKKEHPFQFHQNQMAFSYEMKGYLHEEADDIPVRIDPEGLNNELAIQEDNIILSINRPESDQDTVLKAECLKRHPVIKLKRIVLNSKPSKRSKKNESDEENPLPLLKKKRNVSSSNQNQEKHSFNSSGGMLGLDLDFEVKTFHDFVDKGNVSGMIGSLVKNKFNKEVVNSKDSSKNQMTALHKAAVQGSLKMAEWLIEKGVEIDAKDENDSTPLHIASVKG